jgi:hypothetical protein
MRWKLHDGVRDIDTQNTSIEMILEFSNLGVVVEATNE